MKLGLLTAALGQMSLEQIAAWAPRAGYQALEVAAWPVDSEDVHTAAHLDVAACDGVRRRGTRLEEPRRPQPFVDPNSLH